MEFASGEGGAMPLPLHATHGFPRDTVALRLQVEQ